LINGPKVASVSNSFTYSRRNTVRITGLSSNRKMSRSVTSSASLICANKNSQAWSVTSRAGSSRSDRWCISLGPWCRVSSYQVIANFPKGAVGPVVHQVALKNTDIFGLITVANPKPLVAAIVCKHCDEWPGERVTARIHVCDGAVPPRLESCRCCSRQKRIGAGCNGQLLSPL
jgi:hypothetical protein